MVSSSLILLDPLLVFSVSEYIFETIIPVFLFRYIRSAWKRVLEAVVIAAITACASFNMIYYYDVCQPKGVNNITGPLQVFLQHFVE